MDSLPPTTLPEAFFSSASSSFMDLLKEHSPELLPQRLADAAAAAGTEVPHGTTVVAATFSGGVLIAGDRRTTMGNLIAGRDVDKLSITDDYSAVGFAGTLGISIELARLFALELAHYEKMEGVPLSLAGKTNRLATVIKGNLDMAMAGLASIPLFIGFDPDDPNPALAGRIVSFDAAGGRYDERDGYHAIGSGTPYAKTSLKKLHDPEGDEAAALRVLIEALYDAADEDSATGGPDLVRRIFPTAIRITADGAARLAEEDIAAVSDAVVASRAQRERGTAG